MIAWLAWAAGRVGYWIRPYDMLADRRRWFWQPRQHCGGPFILADDLPYDGPAAPRS